VLPGARLLALAAAVVFAAACRRAPPLASETLALAVHADVTGIFPNPPIQNETYTTFVNRNIFEGLVGFDRHLRIEPGLAARWESPDDRTTICHLRPGVRFSNGEPVVAEDVVASLRAARERGWITRDYLQAIESVVALDATRVRVRTRNPYPVLPTRLPWGFVLPASALQSSPVPPIGTGPYVLAGWTPGKEISFRRNAHYRGRPPDFPLARFVVVPDAAARIERLLRGEADVIDQVPLESVAELESQPAVRVIVRPSLLVLFVGFRVDEPPFSDPRVREAVDLALDRSEIIRRALGGHGDPASQLVPRPIVGYDPTIKPTVPDRARARALLAAAGYPKRLPIRLDGPSNRYANGLEILAEVARQLAEVGIDAEINALDKREFFPLIMRGQSKLYLFGWACGSGEAGDTLDALFRSPAGGAGGTYNTFGVADLELDRLIDDSNQKSGAERAVRLRAAISRVHQLRPLIPLLVQREAMAVSRRVEWDPPLNLAIRLEDIRAAR